MRLEHVADPGELGRQVDTFHAGQEQERDAGGLQRFGQRIGLLTAESDVQYRPVDGIERGTNPTTTAAGYTGYWRAGGDRCWTGTTSTYLAGTIDDVAVYTSAIPASTKRAQASRAAAVSSRGWLQWRPT